MTEKKRPQTANDALRMLHEFLLGEEPDFRSMPNEEVQGYLEEAGVDPNPTIRAIRNQVAKAKGAQALKTARAKRQLRAEQAAHAKGELRELQSMGREQLLGLVHQMVGHDAAAVHLRKYEELDDDDLRSLIEDLKMLDDETNDAE